MVGRICKSLWDSWRKIKRLNFRPRWCLYNAYTGEENPTPSTSSNNQPDVNMDTNEEQSDKEIVKDAAADKVHHCALCHLEISGQAVHRCGKCRRRVYCGKECQVLDWSCKVRGKGQGHKNWCGISYGEEDEDWCVAPVPGKGLGIVAMRSLVAKERILVVENRTIAEIFSSSVSTNPNAKSDIVSSLGRLSLINHACECNSSRFPVEEKAAVVLHAHRDIVAGEEITVSYSAFNETSCTASSESAQESREYLQSTYNIICPADCFCQDDNLNGLIDEGKRIDRSLKTPEVLSKESVNRKLRQVETLLSIQTQVKASLMARLGTLKLGFCLGVMQSSTLPLAMQYLTEAKELVENISHPTGATVRGYEQLLGNVASHPEYLKFD